MPKLSKKHKEWPRIRFFKARNNYVVDAGIKISPVDPKTGLKKRIREYYPTLEEAEVFADQCRAKLKNEGIAGFALNKDKQKLLGEKGASERTINDYKHRLGLLTKQFGSLKINEFKEDKFLDWILKRGDARGLTRTTKALFSFAVNKDYLPENPLRRKTPIPKIGKPSILEDNHWRSLVLTALKTQDQKNSNKGEPIDMLGCVTLGLWCGLRPEAELKRLDWSDVNIDEGFVNIHDDWKVKIGRLVTIPDCAKELLRQCTRTKGPIINPKNFRRRWDWLRETADVTEISRR